MFCRYSKSQSAIEFVIIIGAAMFFVTGMLIAIQNNVNKSVQLQKEAETLHSTNKIRPAATFGSSYFSWIGFPS